MEYIENNLMNNKKIIYHTQLHWIIFLGPFLLLLIAGIVDIIIPIWYTCLFVLWSGLSLMSYLTTDFAVINNYLIIKSRFIRKQSLNLSNITEIQISQSILAKILNYGTIIIKTDKTKNKYYNVSSPLIFQTKIEKQIQKLNNN